MENKSLYYFYFDESNKNGNIKFKNGIPNFWCKSGGLEKGPEYYVGCYIGWNAQNSIVAMEKYQEIENLWAAKFFPGVKGDLPELKSQKLKADYNYGIANFSDRYIDFYTALFQLLIKTKTIYQINIISPLEVLTRDGINISFPASYNSRTITALFYILNKFLYIYSDHNVLAGLENLLTTNDDSQFKESIISKLNNVIQWDKGVRRKYTEVNAFTALRCAIGSSKITVKTYPIKFDYMIDTLGLVATLAEQSIQPSDVILKIDRERDTAFAVKTIFENTTEVDSKTCAGVRMCDIVAGFISSMLKSIAKTLSHDESALSGKKASKNLCVLPKSWFDLTEKQFKLYKILGEFLTSYNSPYFTATTGKNSDDVVMFYSLLFYFKKFDSYENYKRRNLPKHVKEFHAFSMLRLHDAFTRM
jgi:hypothetical protein